MKALPLLEHLIGRRLVWKIGRRLYLHARREGSLDMAHNGEAALQQALARKSAETGRRLRVIDVGANYGQWSRSLLELLRTAGAPPAELTLFEPVPMISEKLAAIIGDFPEHHISIEQSAVSDKPGTASLVVTAIDSGTHHLSGPGPAYKGDMITVPVTSLDVYLDGHGETIDIVKIDAEGFDPKVIAGMEGIFGRGGVDIVQFEYSWLFIRSRAFLYDIFELVGKYGYKIALLTKEGFEIHEVWHPDLEHFYFSAITVLSERGMSHLPARSIKYESDNTHE